MGNTCRDCFYFNGVAEDMNGEVGMCDFQSSEYPNYKVAGEAACDKFNALSLFDKITTSPEVLAEKFVYCNVTVKTITGTSREQPGGIDIVKEWYSTIIPGKVWSSEEEAIAATVVRLKKVEK